MNKSSRAHHIIEIPNQLANRVLDDDCDSDAIARRAFELYESRGREDGHDVEDWLEAERELTTRRLTVS